MLSFSVSFDTMTLMHYCLRKKHFYFICFFFSSLLRFCFTPLSAIYKSFTSVGQNSLIGFCRPYGGYLTLRFVSINFLLFLFPKLFSAAVLPLFFSLYSCALQLNSPIFHIFTLLSSECIIVKV